MHPPVTSLEFWGLDYNAEAKFIFFLPAFVILSDPYVDSGLAQFILPAKI